MRRIGPRRGPATRGITVLLALAVVPLALAGCTFHTPQPGPSQSPQATHPSTPSSAIATDTLQPDTSNWINTLPIADEGKELSTAEAQTGLSLPWKFIGFGTDKTRIQVAYVAGDGDCTLPKGFYVTKHGGGVIVAAVSSASSNTSCSDKVIINRAWITLPMSVDAQHPLQHAPISPNWTGDYFG